MRMKIFIAPETQFNAVRWIENMRCNVKLDIGKVSGEETANTTPILSELNANDVALQLAKAGLHILR